MQNAGSLMKYSTQLLIYVQDTKIEILPLIFHISQEYFCLMRMMVNVRKNRVLNVTSRQVLYLGFSGDFLL